MRVAILGLLIWTAFFRASSTPLTPALQPLPACTRLKTCEQVLPEFARMSESEKPVAVVELAWSARR